jgi:L-alanine-DL-glutamate epimerase-like enolase superfamily enzyme
MQIEEVRLTPFAIPLSTPVKFAQGYLTEAEHILVEVVTEDGAIGRSEAIPRPMIYGETMSSVRTIIEDVLAPQVRGVSVGEIEKLHAVLQTVKGNPVARSSIELAAFDCFAKSLGISCHSLLGGYTDRMRATFILGLADMSTTVKGALAVAASHGVSSFKVKVGHDLARDIQLIKTLRRELPDAVICPDANMAYQPSDAFEFLSRTGDLGLSWIEEPCGLEHLAAKSDLARACMVTPFLGDESCMTPREVAVEVGAGRSSFVSIKMARTGLVDSLAIRDFCATAGASPVVGSQGDSAIGSLTAVSFGAASAVTARHPSELAYMLILEGSVCAQDPAIEDGWMSVPEGHGFGIEIDPDKLSFFGRNF